MKIFTCSLLGLILSFQVFGQTYTGPIAKPVFGYGSDGTHSIGKKSFVNAYYPTEDVVIYHPSDIATPVPTLFYSHAYERAYFTRKAYWSRI